MEKQPESNYILSSDGLQLNYVIRDVQNPQAVVCILHGHGEHKGRYSHVMEYLNAQGIACVAFDFRGHGQSGGKRGHIPSMNQVLNDVEEALKCVRVNYLEIPIFLFGHSFGGCVVLNYILKKPLLELSGFIASSPWLTLAFEPPAWKLRAGKFLAGILPKFALKSELDTKALSRDEHVVREYEEDPLVHSKISARFFQQTIEAGSYALKNQTAVSSDGLIYHGSADQVIDVSATRKFSDHAGPRVEYHELEGVYHEPHNDHGKEKVLSLVSDWILKESKKVNG